MKTALTKDTYCILQMSGGQVKIFCMIKKYGSQLEVCSCFNGCRWLKREYGLKAMYAVLNIRWGCGAKAFGNA